MLDDSWKKSPIFYEAVRGWFVFFFLERGEIKVPMKLTYSLNIYIKMYLIIIFFICKELTATMSHVEQQSEK